MSNLDDIKKKLKIDEMDKDSRQKMFNKFVEKGGEVINEKPVSTSMRFDRHKQIEIGARIKNREDELQMKYAPKHNEGAGKKSGTGSDARSAKTSKYPFFIYFKGLLNGTFSLSGKFSKTLTLALTDEFGEIVSALNFVTNQIIKLDEENRWKMIDYMNKSFSLSYELIMRFYDLYKINTISTIQKYVKTDNNIKCTPILRNILDIYKELTILYPYWESNKEIIWKSLEYYQIITGKQSLIGKQKIYKNIDRLFGYYLPNFHIILTYNLAQEVNFDYESMKKFLDITEDSDIGCFSKQLAAEKQIYLERLKKEKDDSLKKLQESVDQKEMEKIPLYVQKGLKLIDDIVEKSNVLLRNNKYAEYFESNEKMFVFYALFLEFDKQYSFIMTTSQLKLITRSESGEKTDIRSELDECFTKFSEINNFINEYLSLLEEQSNVKIGFNDNPLQLQAKINNIQTKKITTFNEIKVRSAYFFKKLSITLQKLINDYKKDKLLLSNPDDNLSFPLSREKNHFDNVPIIKAIAATFSYVSALHYYISFYEISQKGLFFENNDKDNPADKLPDIENIQ